MTANTKSCEVLLVEDLWPDAKITIEALRRSRLPMHVHHVVDGEEALAYLRREGRFSSAARPDLILLDLNLPKVDGREVLLQLKTDRQLKRIPVVILTGSKAEEDMVRSYDLHANCYVTKPDTFVEFARVVESIEDFWMHLSELPGADS